MFLTRIDGNDYTFFIYHNSNGIYLDIPSAGGQMDMYPGSVEQLEWVERHIGPLAGVKQVYGVSWQLETDSAYRTVVDLLNSYRIGISDDSG